MKAQIYGTSYQGLSGGLARYCVGSSAIVHYLHEALAALEVSRGSLPIVLVHSYKNVYLRFHAQISDLLCRYLRTLRHNLFTSACIFIRITCTLICLAVESGTTLAS